MAFNSGEMKMAKDILDKDTHDAFVSFEQLERETFIGNALATGGHYQAVKPNQYYKVSGNRYAGSTTPDVVRDMWSTPQEIVEWMESEFGEYDLDAAASQENAVCEKFYSKETNCLKRWWGRNKHVWLNPPYSNPTPFIKKAIEQMEHNNQIDVLLPADNSTAWFYEAQKNAAEIIWITGEVYEEGGVEYSRTGRIAFVSGLTGEPVQGNNKGSVIFVMRKLKEGEEQKTRYVKISDICPSVTERRARKRS
ncbi:putative DNA adenine methyltransferase [Escherichia phage vB_EcoD_Poky]|uniref:DNA adenine methyltransferase n=1 Tax=Escherichia phage vB_EcoD_Poky TaxID=2902673 RepID=A0AC61TPD3_9CAUD|nr:putative DNA adenine methyltransferase [Escherichia phage vB_EcoD_Poky]